MPNDYEQHDEEIALPKGSGIPGILEALKGVLSLPRVSQVQIMAPAKITYSFFLRKGEKLTAPVIGFEDVMPYALARNGKIVELPYPSGNAVSACAELFERASRDHMHPVCFLGGDNSGFWPWYEEAMGHEAPNKEELFGFPFLTDRAMEDMALLLCTSYSRGGSITETVKSFKISIPKVSE